MKRKDVLSFLSLNAAFERAPVSDLTSDRRIVIFSDLHMGDGGKADDFLANGQMFSQVLSQYYYPHDYELILNGDVEDLQRFRMDSIARQWEGVYSVFERFLNAGRLYRIVGNHDMKLIDFNDFDTPLHEALRLRYGQDDQTLFVVHGHQTRQMYAERNAGIDFILRYVAKPLRISNRSVSHDSKRKLKVERRVYNFARDMKILPIIGHTHRPLFESLSKLDTIKFEIETLCREYPEAEGARRREVEERIEALKSELSALYEEPRFHAPTGSLYNENLLVPCMFNSGAVIGSRGMTGIEVSGGEIRLVYWFDRLRSQTYLRYRNHQAEALQGTDFHRVVVQRDSLDYIFSRIKLLT